MKLKLKRAKILFKIYFILTLITGSLNIYFLFKHNSYIFFSLIFLSVIGEYYWLLKEKKIVKENNSESFKKLCTRK